MNKIGWTVSFACAWLVLLLGAVMGHAFAEWIHGLPAVPLPELGGFEAARQTDDRMGWDLFVFILRRNMSVYVLLLFGLVSAGLVTFVVLLGNGIAIGQLIGFARLSGMSGGTVVDLLAPHGVLELGALCIAGAVGFQGVRLATDLSRLNREWFVGLRPGLVLGFGLCALTLAAVVEAFVTAELAESLRR